MDTSEAIFARRAVRAYTPRKLDDSALRALLLAAVQAPSAMNLQPWVFAVVQDEAQLKRYSDRGKALLLAQMARDPKAAHYEGMLKDPSFNIFYDARTLVVIGAAERGPYTDADCWLAAGNLMLAATAAGIGSCCIGFAVPVLNTPEVKTELALPVAAVAIAPIILGYPKATPPPVPRHDPRIVSWSRP